ncbi:MAG: hypothetical protein ACRBCL_09975 [Maritimibacter sp.]
MKHIVKWLVPALMLGQAAFAQTDCDRSCLIDAATTLAQGGAAPLARQTENGEVISADHSWAIGAHAIDIHNAYADPSAGQVMVVGTGTGADGEPAIFGLRAKIEAGEARELEWMVTKEGEASLFPRALPVAPDPQFHDSVEEGARTSGARMIELANIYFDGIEISDGAALPVSDTCNRVENGIQMTHSKRFPDMHCNALGLFRYIPTVEQRRFPIVDELHGVVVAIVMFQIPEADFERVVDGKTTLRHYEPRSLYLFEAFKIANDEVQQIEATMRDLAFGQQLDWPLP